MNPIRREVLNGLFVLVISTLLSAAIAAFEIKFNLQVWLLIVIGVAVAASGYIMFEMGLGYMASTEERERALAEAMRRREEEWLKPRVLSAVGTRQSRSPWRGKSAR